MKRLANDNWKLTSGAPQRTLPNFQFSIVSCTLLPPRATCVLAMALADGRQRRGHHDAVPGEERAEIPEWETHDAGEAALDTAHRAEERVLDGIAAGFVDGVARIDVGLELVVAVGAHRNDGFVDGQAALACAQVQQVNRRDDTVVAIAQGDEHAPRVGSIERFAEQMVVEGDDRVGGNHQRGWLGVRATLQQVGNRERLLLGEARRQVRRPLVRQRSLVEVGGQRLEVETERSQEGASARTHRGQYQACCGCGCVVHRVDSPIRQMARLEFAPYPKNKRESFMTLYDHNLTPWLQTAGQYIIQERPAAERVLWVMELLDEMRQFLNDDEYIALLRDVGAVIDERIVGMGQTN